MLPLLFTWLCYCLFCFVFCRMTVIFDIAFSLVVFLYVTTVTWLQYCVTCCSISFTMSVFRCCFRLLYFYSMGQRVRVPLSSRLYWLLVFYRHFPERVVVFRMLSYIYFNGHSFSFIVVLYCPLVSTADVRSFAQPLFYYFSSPVLVVRDELASPGKVL